MRRLVEVAFEGCDPCESPLGVGDVYVVVVGLRGLELLVRQPAGSDQVSATEGDVREIPEREGQADVGRVPLRK
jgi:hypothetical protein